MIDINASKRGSVPFQRYNVWINGRQVASDTVAVRALWNGGPGYARMLWRDKDTRKVRLMPEGDRAATYLQFAWSVRVEPIARIWDSMPPLSGWRVRSVTGPTVYPKATPSALETPPSALETPPSDLEQPTPTKAPDAAAKPDLVKAAAPRRKPRKPRASKPRAGERNVRPD